MIDKDGMEPWEICGMCHSLDGISPMAKFPKLAGQRAAYIEKQFRDIHEGRRTNDGGQMQAIVTEVDPDDLPSIASYFAALPAPPPTAPGEDTTSHAEDLFNEGGDDTPACLTCHGSTSSDVPLAPWLEAQHEEYLEKQLTEFKQGDRTNDLDGVMRSIAARLSEKEIADLASYIAAQPRPERSP
ncbi:c-type cytochrome [Rhodobacterales bacterium]|nr:c-type cytochrome [Rhodobacterales bacterium]